MKRKLIIRFFVGIISLFILVNIGWVVIRNAECRPFLKGLDKLESSTLIVPRYAAQDEYGCTYAVKYPDYLSLTGNLSVCLPEENGNLFVDSLVIWFSPGNKFEYGVVLYDDDTMYQIEIDDKGNPLDTEFKDIVDKHKENIEFLISGANRMWKLN